MVALDLGARAIAPGDDLVVGFGGAHLPSSGFHILNL